MADAKTKLIREALRFANWGAGEGLAPQDAEAAKDPSEFLFEYSSETGDEDWDTLADRLAAPQPAASDVPHDVVRALESSLDDWAYAFANWRQGQRSTPSCEAPGAADIRICRDLIEGMLACRDTAHEIDRRKAARTALSESR